MAEQRTDADRLRAIRHILRRRARFGGSDMAYLDQIAEQAFPDDETTYRPLKEN